MRRRGRHGKLLKGEEESESRVGYDSYPEEYPMSMCYNTFPANAWLKERLEYPLGILLRPFIPQSLFRRHPNLAAAKDISRCTECGAYLNMHCEYNPVRWFCALCGRRNVHTNAQRYKMIDPKLLPELNEVLADYDAPFSDAVPVTSLPIQERPFIHLFVVDETMEMDSLQTAIEALNGAQGAAHPSISFGVLTFSSQRLGLYCMQPGSLLPIIQYVPLSSNQHSTSAPTEQAAGLAATAATEDSFDEQDTFGIHDVIDFASFVQTFGDCRSSFASLLGSIIDVSPESDLHETQSNPNISATPDEDGSLYRTLDTIVQWIFASRFVHFPTSASSSMAKKGGSESTTTASLATMFSLLFSSGNPAATLQQQLQQQLETTYTGVNIHVFLDKKQSTFVTDPHHFASLQQRCLDLNLCLNLWPVCSFETMDVHAHAWKPFVQGTAGQIRRFTLGVNADDEKLRLCEELRRTLGKKYATKCLLKLRTMPIFSVEPASVSGCLQINETDDRNVILAANMLDEDSCFGLRLEMDEMTSGNSAQWNSLDQRIPVGPARKKNGKEPGARADQGPDNDLSAAVFQLVFTYECLVEDPSSLSSSSSAPAVDDDENEGGDGQSTLACLEQHLSILGIDWKDDFHRLLQSASSQESTMNPPIVSPRDHDKLMKLHEQLSKAKSSSQTRMSSSSKGTQQQQQQQLLDERVLRRNAAYDSTRNLLVKKKVRILTWCLACSTNLTQIRESCNGEVVSSLMVREAVHAVGTTASLAPSAQQQPPQPQQLPPIDRLVQRIQHNYAGEADLLNRMVQVLVKAVVLKQVELRKQHFQVKNPRRFTNNSYGSSAQQQEQLTRDYQPPDLDMIHRWLMTDDPQDSSAGATSGVRQVVYVLYRALARLMGATDTSTGMLSDHMVTWMMQVLTAAHPLVQRLVVPTLRGVRAFTPSSSHVMGASTSTSASSASIPSVAPPDAQPTVQRGFDHGGFQVQKYTGVITAPAEVTTMSKATDSNPPNHVDNEEESSNTELRCRATMQLSGSTLPLRRDAMMTATLTASYESFLLDCGNELVLYTPLQFHQGPQPTKENQNPPTSASETVTNGPVCISAYPYLATRFLYHPLLPRLSLARAGTLSAPHFTTHLLEDVHEDPNLLSFVDCQALTLQILKDTALPLEEPLWQEEAST